MCGVRRPRSFQFGFNFPPRQVMLIIHLVGPVFSLVVDAAVIERAMGVIYVAGTAPMQNYVIEHASAAFRDESFIVRIY